jgi:hypothetical protein
MYKKTVVLLFVAIFGAMLANVSAHAQDVSVAVKVPFDFVVGKHTLKAGSYRLQKQGSFVAITNNDDRRSTYAMLNPSGAAKLRGEAYLVFRRYGNEAFLNSVVFSEDRHYDVPHSSKEKELMSKLVTGEQIALLLEPGQ